MLIPSRFGGGVSLASLGAYVPPRRVDNAELVRLGAALSEAEILRLSGIEARHWVDDATATSDLARRACEQALERAQRDAKTVDRLIVATVSPDHPSPSAACIVQHGLGLRPVPAFDVTASCSGFLYALDAAARAILTGDASVLAVAADVRSRFLNLSDRATCALFGDGAGALLVQGGPKGAGLEAIALSADGRGWQSVFVPAGGSREVVTAEALAARRNTIRMNEGPQVYFDAVEGMVHATKSILAELGLSLADVALVVPHQPNKRILDRYRRVLGLPEDKLVVTVDRFGNTSGASVALALDVACREGRVRVGDRVLLVTAGAGYTVGAASFIAESDFVASFAKR